MSGLLFLAAGLPALGANWQAPEPVSVSNGDNPWLGYDGQGNLYAIFKTSSSDEVAIRPPGGGFGTAFSPPHFFDVEDLEVGFDSAGNAIFAWIEFDTLNAVRRTAGPAGTFGTPQTVDDNSRDFDLSVNPAGDAMLVWDEDASTGPVKVAFRPAGAATTFGAGTDLAATQSNLSLPVVVLDPDRAAVAVWTDRIESGQLQHRQATQPAGSAVPSFGTGVDLALSDGKQSKAQNAAGRAVVAWRQFVPIPGGTGVDIIAAIRDPGGAFAAPESLGDPENINGLTPVTAVGPGGDIGVGWDAVMSTGGCTPGAAKAVFAVAVAGANSFGPAVMRGGAMTHADEPSIAFDSDGEPLVVWNETIGDPCVVGGADHEIRAAVGLGGAGEVISAVDDVIVDATALARQGGGNAFAAWESGLEVVGAEFTPPCDAPDGENQTLHDDTITGVLVVDVCDTIVTGPNFHVQGPGGDLTLKAGVAVILGEGTSVGVDAKLKVDG